MAFFVQVINLVLCISPFCRAIALSDVPTAAGIARGCEVSAGQRHYSPAANRGFGLELLPEALTHSHLPPEGPRVCRELQPLRVRHERSTHKSESHWIYYEVKKHCKENLHPVTGVLRSRKGPPEELRFEIRIVLRKTVIRFFFLCF